MFHQKSTRNVGKSITAQPKVPTTSIAFGRGLSIGRKKTATATKQQQQQTSSQQARATGKIAATSSHSTPSIIRRFGSVGQLNDGGKNAPGAMASTASMFKTTSANSRRCQCRDPFACVCKCMPSMAFLEGVYVQNLQTQIEVLELENAYLLVP